MMKVNSRQVMQNLILLSVTLGGDETYLGTYTKDEAVEVAAGLQNSIKELVAIIETASN